MAEQKQVLLVETPEAAAIAEDLVQIPGIDEMFIGLNDLSLGYGKILCLNCCLTVRLKNSV